MMGDGDVEVGREDGDGDGDGWFVRDFMIEIPPVYLHPSAHLLEVIWGPWCEIDALVCRFVRSEDPRCLFWIGDFVVFGVSGGRLEGVLCSVVLCCGEQVFSRWRNRGS